jgi:hypothetical protein
MTIEILAQSIARLGSLTQNVGGRIAVAVTDTRELWVVDLSVPGGDWTNAPSEEADCVLAITSRALKNFADPDAFRISMIRGEVAVMGATDKLQALALLIDLGPGWVTDSEDIHAAA